MTFTKISRMTSSIYGCLGLLLVKLAAGPSLYCSFSYKQACAGEVLSSCWGCHTLHEAELIRLRSYLLSVCCSSLRSSSASCPAVPSRCSQRFASASIASSSLELPVDQLCRSVGSTTGSLHSTGFSPSAEGQCLDADRFSVAQQGSQSAIWWCMPVIYQRRRGCLRALPLRGRSVRRGPLLAQNHGRLMSQCRGIEARRADLQRHGERGHSWLL